MDVLDQVRIIIYRFHEKGLEIFLVNRFKDQNAEEWFIPEGTDKNKLKTILSPSGEPLIELDPYKDANGRIIHTFAIEGDWHDIPSIRGLIRQDLHLIKNKLKEKFSGIEKTGFFAIKEALKIVMPTECNAIKELKDILWDRNALRNI